MLINCPKCGFQQPKDKYCARCGVDMETYRPPEIPAYKKFFGNPAIQLTLLVLVAGVIGFTLFQRGKHRMDLRNARNYNAELQINTVTNSRLPASSQELQAKNALTNTQEHSADALPPAPQANDGTPTPSPTDTPKEKIKGSHLIVTYAEVPMGILQNIFEISQNTGQFMHLADNAAGILPGVSKLLTDRRDIKILHKEDRVLDSSKNLQWFFGLKDRQNPSVEIGLTTFFDISEVEGGTLRGNFELQRVWRESPEPGSYEVQRKSFPAILEINKNNGFFMSGVMPRVSNLPNEDELTSIDVYRILRSPAFRQGATEFVIFVEFIKGN
jgi:hypothetical protein